MKRIAGIVVLTAIVIAAYTAAGPFITLYQIKGGIEDRDSAKLSEHIDFPALRVNLKEQINALVMKEAVLKMKDSPFAGLLKGLASKLADSMVDSFVTPSGLANLMEGKKPQQGRGAEEPAGSGAPAQKLDLLRNARFTYDSASRFSSWVKTDNGEEIRFVLTRDGLSWKLSNIVVPMKN